MVVRMLAAVAVVAALAYPARNCSASAVAEVQFEPWQEFGALINTAGNGVITDAFFSFGPPFDGGSTFGLPERCGIASFGCLPEDWFIDGQNFQTVHWPNLQLGPGEAHHWRSLDHDFIETVIPPRVGTSGGSIAGATFSVVFDSGIRYTAPLRNIDASVAQTIQLPVSVFGDTFPQVDGTVNIDDLNNVRNHFGNGTPLGPPVPGDTFPFDGIVDIGDVNRVRNYFGTQNTAVPEPTAVTLCVLSVVLLALRRREPDGFAIRRPAR